jgi:uncharacterized protein (TIRG00374 family)
VTADGAPDDLDRHLELQEDAQHEGDENEVATRGAALLRDRRRVLAVLAAVVLMIVAIYVVFPKVVGLNVTFDKFDEATWYWLVVAFCMPVVSYGGYTVITRSVYGQRGPAELERRWDTRVSALVTLASLAASALFSAAGAGGIALTYWAMRKSGMSRRRAACRLVAFNVITYGVYLLTVIVFGVLLAAQVLPGQDAVSVTIIPAALAGGCVLILALVALVPDDLERRLRDWELRPRLAKFARRLAAVPATLALGTRTAVDHVRDRRLGPPALAGAILFWAGNIATLWATFKAFGVSVPFGVLVQGFFVGMAANLMPSPAAGVGTVDAGLIGAFVVFGQDADAVFPAVLVFRLIGFWMPIPLGIVAYLRMLPLAQRWEAERATADTIQSEVKAKPGEVRA